VSSFSTSSPAHHHYNLRSIHLDLARVRIS
jgi:hypothetical protein